MLYVQFLIESEVTLEGGGVCSHTKRMEAFMRKFQKEFLKGTKILFLWAWLEMSFLRDTNSKQNPLSLVIFFSIPWQSPQKLLLWTFLRLYTLRGIKTTFLTVKMDGEHNCLFYIGIVTLRYRCKGKAFGTWWMWLEEAYVQILLKKCLQCKQPVQEAAVIVHRVPLCYFEIIVYLDFIEKTINNSCIKTC